MLLVPTKVGPSRIEGLGLLAAEPIAAGTEVWRWHPVFDVFVPDAEVAALPEMARAFLDRYAYPAPDLPDGLLLNLDDARFMNHSDDPTLDTVGEVCVARRDIVVGEELTCDYGAFHPELRDAIQASGQASGGAAGGPAGAAIELPTHGLALSILGSNDRHAIACTASPILPAFCA